MILNFTILLFLTISSVFFWIRYKSKDYTPLSYDISDEVVLFGNAITSVYGPGGYLDLRYPNNSASLSLLEVDSNDKYHLIL